MAPRSRPWFQNPSGASRISALYRRGDVSLNDADSMDSGVIVDRYFASKQEIKDRETARQSVLDSLKSRIYDNKRWKDLPTDTQQDMNRRIADVLNVPLDGAAETMEGEGEGEESYSGGEEMDSHSASFLVDILDCFARLGLKSKYVDAQVMESILNSLSYFRIGVSNVDNVLFSLQKIGLRWNEITPRGRRRLVEGMTTRMQSIKPNHIGNLLYSLGALQCRWDSLPVATREIFYEGLSEGVPFMGGKYIAHTFWGLGRMGARWSALPVPLRHSLCEHLTRNAPLAPQTLSSSLLGMRHMLVQWPQSDAILRTAVLDNLMEVMSSRPPEHSLSTIVSCLGSIGMPYQELSDESVAAICVAIGGCKQSFTNQGLTSVWYGLAKMEWLYHEVPEEMREHLADALDELLLPEVKATRGGGSKRGHVDTAMSVSNMVWSMGAISMLLPCSTMKKPGQEKRAGGSNSAPVRACLRQSSSDLLLEAVSFYLQYMSEQGVFGTLVGLAKMDVRWHDLPASTRDALLAALCDTIPLMDVSHASNVPWALSKMELTWSEMETMKLSDKFMEALTGKVADMTAHCISITTYSLAQLQCDYQALPAGFRDTLQQSCFENLQKMSAREIAILLYGFGKMDVNFHREFSLSLRKVLLKSYEDRVAKMSMQNLGNSIWGLCGRMNVPYSTLPESCREQVTVAIIRGEEQIGARTLRAILHGLSGPNTEKWMSLDFAMQEALLLMLRKVIQRSKKKPSPKLIGNILYALGRLQTPWNSHADDVHSERVLPLPDDVGEELLAQFTNSMEGVFSLATSTKKQPKKDYHSRALNFGLNGLARMMTWESVNEQQRDKVFALVLMAISSVKSPVDLANLVWSLGAMHLPLADLSAESQAGLFSLVESHVTDMGSFEVVWTLWALQQMSVTFESMPGPARKVLINRAIHVIPDVGMKDLGIIMASLDSLKIPSDDDSANVANELFFRRLHVGEI